MLFFDDYCVCMSLSNQTLGKVVYFTEAFCFRCYTAFEILKLALNRLQEKYNTSFTIHVPKWTGSWKYKITTHKSTKLTKSRIKTKRWGPGTRDSQQRNRMITWWKITWPTIRQWCWSCDTVEVFSHNFSLPSQLKSRAMQGLIWSRDVLSFYSPLNVQNLSHNPQQQPREAAHWSTQRFHSLHASTDAVFWTLPICEAASWSASVALKTVLQYHATKEKEIDRQLDRQISWGAEARAQFEPLGDL